MAVLWGILIHRLGETGTRVKFLFGFWKETLHPPSFGTHSPVPFLDTKWLTFGWSVLRPDFATSGQYFASR